MKKIIFALFGLIIFSLISSCEKENQKEIKTDKYLITNNKGEQVTIRSHTTPQKVIFDSRLGESENIEVIQKGSVKKEHISKDDFGERGIYSLSKKYKNYRAENKQGKIIVSHYSETTETALNWGLIATGIIFFFGFFFLRRYGQKEISDSSIGVWLFVIGVVIVFIFAVISFFYEKAAELFPEMFFVGWTLLVLGASYLSYFNWCRCDYLEENCWAIFPVLVLLIIEGIAYRVGENANFLIFNILLPAITGLLLSFYIYPNKEKINILIEQERQKKLKNKK